MVHHHNHLLVILSVIIAVFSSYVALDLANSLAIAKGRARWFWLLGGSLAMGTGIWSMHFVAMLAFSMPGVTISYDVPLLILSILVAVAASAMTLTLVSRDSLSPRTFVVGSLCMGAAISGMHYIGIASMRMAAIIYWNTYLVIASIVIAVVASFVALLLAFKLRNNTSTRGFQYRGAGGIIMGFAISGMHYTAMAAMHIVPSGESLIQGDQLLATNGLAVAVIIATIVILCIALFGSIMERELSRRIGMNTALKTAIRTRDEFLSIASHEFKTPLTSIKLQNQLILRTVVKNSNLTDVEKEKLSSMLNQTDKSIERLARLVDDLLDISRISTGKFVLQLETFDLSELMKDTVERLVPLLSKSNCQVELKKIDEVVGTWDKFRIEQVIINILTNAARYGAGKPIEVKIFKDGNFAKICIKDFGRGIASEDLERIFQKFERANLPEETKGLGLGLFIVKEILQMHHGNIQIISEVNKGSEFIVTLPLG